MFGGHGGSPQSVMPAQAGVQKHYRYDGRATALVRPVWIPACAGMTREGMRE